MNNSMSVYFSDPIDIDEFERCMVLDAPTRSTKRKKGWEKPAFLRRRQKDIRSKEGEAKAIAKLVNDFICESKKNVTLTCPFNFIVSSLL